MKIIGIQASGPGTAAALVVDSQLTAVAEERLSRQRHAGDFPARAVKYLLSAASIEDINGIDAIVVSDRGRGSSAPVQDTIRARLSYNGKIHQVGNHDAHAAATFFTSPFDDAAVLVADFAGSLCQHVHTDPPHYLRAGDDMQELQCTYRGTGVDLVRIQTTPSTGAHRHGLLDLYAAISAFLNFGPHGLGRVTDLATFGGRKPLGFPPLVTDYDGDVVGGGSKNYIADPSALGRDCLGDLKPRRNQALPDDIYTEIAHKVQTETTEAVVAMAARLQRVTRSRSLCIGGAIAFNGPVMAQVAAAGFDHLHVFPTGDGVSVAVGCALWGAKVLQRSGRRYDLRNGCLGPEHDEASIRRAIEGNENLTVTRLDTPAEEVARLLVEGRSVAWFRGASEAGPRGLGHRSVLAPISDEQAMERVRSALGRGEDYRPYGVAVLEEFHRTCFALPCAAPWMTLSAPFNAKRSEVLAKALGERAAVPVQTVSRRTDAPFYRVLDQYYRAVGAPLLINAPLRRSGQPLAETPADAVDFFLRSGVHALVLGPFRVEAHSRAVADPVRPTPIPRAKGVRTRIKEALGFR